MPPVLVAIGAAIAGYGAGAAAAAYAVSAGYVVAGGIGAALISGVVGAVVAGAVGYGLNAVLGLNASAKKANAATLSENSADRKQLIRGSVEARKLIYGGTLTSGVMVYAASSGTDQRYLHLVVALAGHRIQAIYSVFVNDWEITVANTDGSGNVTGGQLAGKAICRRYLGTQTTADSTLVAESPDGWDSSHKLLGCAYVYLRLEYSQDLFPSGLQNVKAFVGGKDDIYDPRTTSSGYTNNFALCVLDYLRSPLGMDCDDDEIDYPSFSAAANIADENVQLDAGATEFQKRYTIDGVISLDRSPMAIMEDMLTAGCGTLVYVQGKYRLYAGAYDAPSDTLTASDLAGEVTVRTRPSRSDLWNAARGTFIDPSRFWQASEFPPLHGLAFEDEDNGERIFKDLEFPLTTDPTRAQRLARIMLWRARESLTITVPVRYAGIRYCVWQTLAVTLSDLGWSSKPFRVLSWSFEPESGIINLTLQEESAGSYGWLYDYAATIPPAPNTDLIDPLTLPAPTSLVVTASVELNADGASVLGLNAAWVAAAHAFVTAHEVQWRVATSGTWASVLIPVPTVIARLTPIIAGTSYEVRVRAVAGLVRGPWSSTVTTAGVADTTAPGLPTSLTATGIVRGVALRWTNPSDKDLRYVEVWERPSTGGSSAKIGESGSDFFTRTGMTAGDSAYYKVRAVDLSGNTGSFTSEVTGTTAPITAGDIQDGILDIAKFASSLVPPKIVTSVPATLQTDGAGRSYLLVFNTTNGKLYRWNGSAYVLDVAVTDIIGQITATQITDGAISTPKLAANAITASKISLVPTSLNLDPYFEDSAAWTFTGGGLSSGGWYIEAASGGNAPATLGVRKGVVLYSGYFTGSGANTANGVNRIPCTPGELLAIRAKGFNSGNKPVEALIAFVNSSGTFVSSSGVQWAAGASTPAFKEAQVTVPSGAVAAYPQASVGSGAAWSGTACIGDVSIVRPATAAMVVDGEIRTNHIASDAITTGLIAAGAVTADEMASNSLRARHLGVSEELIANSANIKDLTVVTAKIGNDAVSTFKQSVVPRGSYVGGSGASSFAWVSGTTFTIGTDREGFAIGYADVYHSATPRTFYLRIMVNSAEVFRIGSASAVVWPSIMTPISLTAGSNTVEMEWAGEDSSVGVGSTGLIIFSRAK